MDWLEQEPTTKNDLGVDCISREQAKAAIRDKFKDLPLRVEINTILNELPSVILQKPKTGHWIDDISLGYHISICSNCDWRGHGDTCLIYKPKYCPNCGAKMSESQENEE